MKTVTVRQMQELDRKAIEEIGIPSLTLMENAGKGVSEAALDMLKTASGKRLAIFCGTGNNGGDGFVAARYLSEKGVAVEVYIVGERPRIKNNPLVNLERLEENGIHAVQIESPININANVIIDAIFGIGLEGEVKEPARSIIIDLNKKNIPILAVDVPSGLDADTGEVWGEAVRAKKTVAMQFAKKGFYINKGPDYVGEVVVVDIGIL